MSVCMCVCDVVGDRAEVSCGTIILSVNMSVCLLVSLEQVRLSQVNF